MHTDPDYSAAYVVLRTDADDGVEGHGLTFTSGRGHRGVRGGRSGRSSRWSSAGRSRRSRPTCAASGAASRPTRSCAGSAPRKASSTSRPPQSSTRSGTCGPSARASRSGSSSSDMTPEQLVGCVDFRYIADALAPEEAIELLQDARRRLRRVSARSSPRGIRRTRRRRAGSATATTRWSRSCGEALAAGFTHVKMKVGADLDADDRRAALIRRALGPAGIADDGRQPGLGRRRGNRRDAGAAGARPVVDRGADEP